MGQSTHVMTRGASEKPSRGCRRRGVSVGVLGGKISRDDLNTSPLLTSDVERPGTADATGSRGFGNERPCGACAGSRGGEGGSED